MGKSWAMFWHVLAIFAGVAVGVKTAQAFFTPTTTTTTTTAATG